ncbi:MAG: hypothetical protein IPL46_23570 [Saprospiraceae bacterium]|nr:hypothetical protein [Saprospiraceae bacterium]
MNTQAKSRRHFLSRFFSKKEDATRSSIGDSSITETKKTKMLTPDGKLVEVSGHVIDSNKRNKKTNNAEILKWMGVKKN